MLERNEPAEERAAESQASLELGAQFLLRMLELGASHRGAILEGVRVFEAIPASLLGRLSGLAGEFLAGRAQTPVGRATLLHVLHQHIGPMKADAAELEGVFGIEIERLRLLALVHDLGKLMAPTPLSKLFRRLFPADTVARDVLLHEYVSMYWIQALGDSAGLSAEQIRAVQMLVANHNFGVDLTQARGAGFRAHWWPEEFRRRVIPGLARGGFPVDSLFPRSAEGTLEYPSAESNRYSLLLAIYDRAIASRLNGDGSGTISKLAAESGVAPDAAAIARDAKAALLALWGTLARHHAAAGFRLESFGPFRRQWESLDRMESCGLLQILPLREKAASAPLPH